MKRKNSFLIVAFVVLTLACISLFRPSSTAAPVTTPFHTPKGSPTVSSSIQESSSPEPMPSSTVGTDNEQRDTLCKNPFYPVVKGAKWIYKLTGSEIAGTILYRKIAIVDADPRDGTFSVYDDPASYTEDFPPFNE